MLKFNNPKKLDFKQPYVWLATWFGCGFLSPAPGTWGSLGALPVGILLIWLGGLKLLLPAIIIVSVLGYWAADKFDKAAEEEDSKMIVIDEVVGMWMALITAGLEPALIITAFLAFRFFDILKPYPISFLDKNIKGPVGVMADDMMAGLYAALIVIMVKVILGL